MPPMVVAPARRARSARSVVRRRRRPGRRPAAVERRRRHRMSGWRRAAHGGGVDEQIPARRRRRQHTDGAAADRRRSRVRLRRAGPQTVTPCAAVEQPDRPPRAPRRRPRAPRRAHRGSRRSRFAERREKALDVGVVANPAAVPHHERVDRADARGERLDPIARAPSSATLNGAVMLAPGQAAAPRKAHEVLGVARLKRNVDRVHAQARRTRRCA